MIEFARIKQLLLFGLLAVVTFAVYDNFFADKESPLFQPFTKGYSLQQVVIETSDEQGQIVTTIKSPAVIHYADSKKTLIRQPNITLHENDGDWVFQSAVGEINPNQTEIYFPEQVFLELNESDINANEMTIETSQLLVNLNDKVGKTAALINMKQLGAAMKGKGAVVDFNRQEIEILSEMYAEFKN
ncbi:LPS export ABC transporter periplasmic protein LptC [Marinicella sp. S1101]|uniref:LPS export ABC transporter periplasmic protein LptC n=1 Tax=Marinicella marina TaxID=2996016 RepID=UPI0022609886|nr:LPS export ABC transporter periplasmic protein LptC [Marinicella marina]MCX7554627.1 LPS export ABC transporter periplasmic protein LptC [Marinicella marina]MDJ1140692.1 LPS export ABC transporter periplasmic protein LptC [Marinicella marina]